MHRRLLNDDARGVTEPLNETEFVRPYGAGPQKVWGQHHGPGLITRGRHFLVLSPVAGAARRWRALQDRLYLPLHPAFTSAAAKEPRQTFLQRPLDDRLQVRPRRAFGGGGR